MDVVKILLVFGVIILAIRFKRPLWQAVAGGTVVTGLLFALPVGDFFITVGKAAIAVPTLKLLGAVYVITVLQKLMGQRSMLQHAERATTALMQNRRLSVAVSPVLIGLLPAPGSVLMAGEMVKAGCDGQLSKEEMACVTSFYRHVPESFLPTYNAVIAALALSGVPAGQFMLWMLPTIFVLMLVPYVLYLRKIPKAVGAASGPGAAKGGSRLSELGRLFYYLWPVILTILFILALGLEPLIAASITAVLFALIGRFSLTDLAKALKEAFDPKVLAGMWVIMMFKDVFAATGAAGRLPETLSGLPIPGFLIFAIIFFMGALIGSQQAMIALVMPMAFAATGQPLAMTVLLMSFGHMGSQFAPTHVCLPLACEYFGVQFGQLVKKTLPIAAICLVRMNPASAAMA